MELHEQLADAREKAGLSQTDLAIKLGITPSAVSQWETGRTIPTRARLNEISEICGAHIAWRKRAPDMSAREGYIAIAQLAAKIGDTELAMCALARMED